MKWAITISESFMRIGCQRHSHKDWYAFADSEIESMADEALSFWAQNKAWLLAACEAHRKESLAYRETQSELEDKE